MVLLENIKLEMLLLVVSIIRVVSDNCRWEMLFKREARYSEEGHIMTRKWKLDLLALNDAKTNKRANYLGEVELKIPPSIPCCCNFLLTLISGFSHQPASKDPVLTLLKPSLSLNHCLLLNTALLPRITVTYFFLHSPVQFLYSSHTRCL